MKTSFLNHKFIFKNSSLTEVSFYPNLAGPFKDF